VKEGISRRQEREAVKAKVVDSSGGGWLVSGGDGDINK
jgi:hypothetical protein